ncbi:ring-1,2-phenylacetyl-CoA epoxidase subunit PaaC [Psychroflexus salarius]|uniref:Ring-1,2-phenylacetyl-CoA epoxidase subunit PaaC n=1 Tax=Psychroflexus salarius TaxID=1155689 RepID=A0A1M4U3Z0_9FLAO|nr:1,2-phenylacetyl-CoA epoxidase subunit PaaC [Psychroflexus salarius]SHE51356.1 ring-1,2-phenylacetyl-CoA epoxidase subunit PaaC [Psychroflexus salarius]
MTNQNLIKYIYGIADNALILGQRISELCGHGPTLETDIAMTNIALDLLGQTRSYYQYIAELSKEDITEDDVAFLRKEREYLNVLLVEQPNTDFAHVITRQYFFDEFHFRFLEQLQESQNVNLQAIAKKSIKEVAYHRQFSRDWVKRLGDGTEVSHEKIQLAVSNLWPYTNELFMTTNDDVAAINSNHGIDVSGLKNDYFNQVAEVLNEATLKIPDLDFFQKGGKKGIHTEHMGFILSDLQYMQRTYPNMKW